MSEKTLDKLIETLRTEAIESADLEAKKILDKAQAEADRILSEAESKRVEVLNAAEKEAQNTLNKGVSALNQAARDLHVQLRNDLLKLLGNVLENEVDAAFDSDLTEKAVLAAVQSLGQGLDVKLPDNLAESIQKKLQESDGISSVNKDSSLLKGFVVSKSGEGWAYEISPKELSEQLSGHLSSKWVQILSNSSEE